VLEARLESDQRFEEIKKGGVRTRFSRGECGKDGVMSEQTSHSSGGLCGEESIELNCNNVH
jgi:hypothetical protein